MYNMDYLLSFALVLTMIMQLLNAAWHFIFEKNSKSVEAPRHEIESHDRYIFHTCLAHAHPPISPISEYTHPPRQCLPA